MQSREWIQSSRLKRLVNELCFEILLVSVEWMVKHTYWDHSAGAGVSVFGNKTPKPARE